MIKLKKILFIKDINDDTYTIEDIGTKEIYASNGNGCSKWVREEVKGIAKSECVVLTNSINIKNKKLVKNPKMIKNALGFFHNNANAVYHNVSFVGIYSSPIDTSNGLSVIPENYKKVIALFTARKSIKPTWINCKDEYLVPNTDHPDYEQWNNDAIVYSLFNNSSQQSSLRDIIHKDKKWDMVNNFFFMSNAEMADLANDHNYREMYNDTKAFNEDRYVYNLLQETNISDDAQEILDMAKELMKKSFEEREDYGDEHPKYHLHCWDAGWAQLKPMLKERYKEDYDAFVVAYKEFENRMRTGVYKFGFLKE